MTIVNTSNTGDNDEFDLPTVVLDPPAPTEGVKENGSEDEKQTEAPGVQDTDAGEDPGFQNARAPLPPCETFREDRPTLLPLTKPFDEDAVTLDIPACGLDQAKKILEQDPEIRRDSKWSLTLRSGFEIWPNKDMYSRTVTREGAEFRYGVNSERGVLAAAKPSWRSSNSGGKITGERGVLRIRDELGIGGTIQIPLWHSGFWITIKAPSESSLLELERVIAREKIILGRQTNGAAFSNVSCYIAQHVLEFALRHIYDSSLVDNESVRDLLVVHDLSHLAWGLAAAIWPSGFQYRRAVFGLTQDEDRVVEGWINIGKNQATDSSELTPWQISHMSRRGSSSMSVESVRRYQEEFKTNKGRKTIILDKLALSIRLPSLTDYITSGQRWVNGIVQMVDIAMGTIDDIDERNRYILEQSKATAMRQYSHWVESIELLDADGNAVSEVSREDGEETLEELLNELSTDDAIREEYFKAIESYIEDSTISIISVTTVTPEEENIYPRFPHQIPIDPMMTFFTLVGQKLARLKTREM